MTRDSHHAATFHGRPLARPAEEIVDQGLRFDLDTLLARRGLLRMLGVREDPRGDGRTLPR